MSQTYHEGELEVQRRAGVKDKAARVGGIIKPTIPEIAQRFIEAQPLVIVASRGAEGAVWASVLTGEPGFVTVLDEQTVHVGARPYPSDPLHANLQENLQVGLLAIEFATRRRMRLNGRAGLRPDGTFEVTAEQVYSNCPKYIQARQAVPGEATCESETKVCRDERLIGRQQDWIAGADTFFIASSHPAGGADASHRGGEPGFITVEGPQRLIWPDYAGNMMFNTLGNIAAQPRVGLLFLDFERGTTLQLSGRATIIWDEAEVSAYRGAERLVTFMIEQVVETQRVLPLRWRFESFSPHNP